MALLKRLVEGDRPALDFTLDGQPASGLLGDTVLTAVLTCGEHSARQRLQRRTPRRFLPDGRLPGLLGTLGDGRRVRACSTLLEAGQHINREPGRRL
jgi:hypothetical protein